MLYLAHIPGPPLVGFVECMWSLGDAPVHATERIVPSGTLELVINLHEDEIRIYDPDTGAARRFSGAVVSGAYRRFFVIDTREHASLVGVHFRPGGAGPFLGVPPGALVDQHVDLETLWHGSAVELRDRLCETACQASRFAIIEQALLRRLVLHRGGHPVVPLALAQLERPGTGIGDLATSLHLSQRRFIEVFTAEVGMTPKRLARVLRFQRALAHARLGTPDWARLAAACGYFDQSHLIHDFRELTGMSPVSVMRASAGVKDHHVAA
ncbi:MAG TPA: helix-turn-helix transcriptional regulator [Kofleriaceae bacterium]|nr:helix-turn-helix transcriptional regulator [Kofleriaceae bacterium]